MTDEEFMLQRMRPHLVATALSSPTSDSKKNPKPAASPERSRSKILEAKIQTAARFAKPVFDSGLARVERSADMISFIRRHLYKPEYPKQAAAPPKAA